MLTEMPRRARGLVCLAAIVTACGGESFTVVDGTGGNAGTGGSAPGVGVDSTCNDSRDCVLVALDCCSFCPPTSPSLTAASVIAIRRDAASAYHEQLCVGAADTCVRCPDTVSVQGVEASCANSQCVVATIGDFGGG